MTTPRPGRHYDELPPSIELEEIVRTAAGTAVPAHAVVTNRSTEPRIIAVTFLGVDADWLPGPSRSRVLMPGETVSMDYTLHPSAGTLPARYPFAVTVQAVDPASSQAMSPATIGDVVLVVDAAGRIDVQVDPPEITRRTRAAVSIDVTNVGLSPEVVRLEFTTASIMDFTVPGDEFEVAPGTTRRIPAKVKIESSKFGRPVRYTYTVTARGSNAARRAEGAITRRSTFGAAGPKAFVIVATVALWATMAIIFIPKLADTVRSNENKSNDQASSLQQKAQDALNRNGKSGAAGSGAAGNGSGSAAGGGSGGSGSGGSGSGNGGSGGSGSGSGGSGSGGSGSGGSGSTAADANAPKPVQFSGTVGGDSPSGVTVAMRPTSLVDEAVQGAQGVGVDTSTFTKLGKIPEGALTATTATAPRGDQNRNTTTKTDGSWAFARVANPGYYLVTFSKTGFQTQRYVVDAASAASAEPMKVTLVPGQGRLSGRITGPGGDPVRGAAMTISDGTNIVSTSSNSRGDVGAWSVDGLSTPATYLLTVNKDGLSTESRIVTLGAGDTATANLTLKRNSTTLVGSVTGPDSRNRSVDLGGVQVTAQSGSTVRTSTTITSGSLKGTYRLPDLPNGRYIVTTTAAGYLTQTQPIVITQGEVTVPIRTELTSATATVTGVVTGVQFNDDGSVQKDGTAPVYGPVNGAGITLSSDTNRYKITTGDDGSFQMNGVEPGTYVLSAQFAGLSTAFANVVAKAGQAVSVDLGDLKLPASSTTNQSTITGFAASATNPSGALTCPDGTSTSGTTDSTKCVLSLTLLDSEGNPVPTRTDDSPPPASQFDTTSTAKPSQTGPTGYTLRANEGLGPGVYRLIVGSTGYLPTTVIVRVPANNVATAPLASLFRANTVTGSIQTLGDIAADGPNPTYKTCVFILPQDTFGRTTAPTSCTAPDTTTNRCESTGEPQAGFSLVGATPANPDPKSYRIAGLCDGTYDLYVFTENPWYVNSSVPASQTLTRGQTVNYSPRIARDGQVLLSVSVLDPEDGATKPLAGSGVTGTVSCVGANDAGTDFSRGSLAAATNGVVTVRGVDADGNVTCTVTGTGAGNVAYTGTVGGLVVANDNDTSAGVVLYQKLGPVYAQVTSPYGANDPDDASLANKVKSVSFTVSGISSYNGGTAVPFGPTSVTTDANGCFGISPTANTITVPAGQTCAGSVPALNVPLAARSIKVVSDDTPGFDAINRTITFVSNAVTPISVRATPRSSANRITVVAKSEGNVVTNAPIASATVKITPATTGGKSQAVAAGTISANAAGGVNPGGGRYVTLVDDAINVSDRLSPGTYDIAASLAGYESATDTITCTLNSTCTTPTLVLTQRGGLSGTISGVQGTTRQYADPVQPTIMRDYPSNMLTGATVKAVACATGTTTGCTGAEKSVQTLDGGKFEFKTGSADTALAPGDYEVTVSATGYDSYTQPVHIGGGDNTLSRQYLLATPVTLKVSLTIGQTTTKYQCAAARPCTVTLTRKLSQVATVQTTQDTTTNLFTFPDISPGDYSIAVRGDDICACGADVPTIDPGTSPSYNLPITITKNNVNGSVSAPALTKAATVAPRNDIPIDLGTRNADGVFTVAQSTDGTPLSGKTSTVSGSPGQFQFNNVPNGNYVARYNFGDDRVDGYRPQVFDQVITVNGGNGGLFTPVTLTTVTRDVPVTITTTDDDDDISGSTLVVTNATDPTWTYSNPSVDGQKFTFSQIPYGSWKLSVALPANHFGTLSDASGATLTSCALSSGTPKIMNCAATFTVAGTDGSADDLTNGAPKDKAIGFTLDEDNFVFGAKGTKLALQQSYTGPSTLKVTVKDGATTVFPATELPVATSGDPSTSSFWGGAGKTYTPTATITGSFPAWSVTAPDALSDSAATTFEVKESGSKVTVKVTDNGTGPLSGYRITLIPPSTTITAPTAKTTAPPVEFDDIPYGTGWTARVEATRTVTTTTGTPPDTTTTTSTVPVDKTSAAFPINSGTTSVTITVP